MELEQVLTDPELRARLLDACEEALTAEVASKSGVTGIAIRGAYATFQAVRPGMVRHMFGTLLPSFVPALTAHWNAARDGDVRAYFDQHRPEVAGALLEVTDARAERASSNMLKRLYRSLRGRAEPQVCAAVPRIADILASVLSDRALV